MRTWILALSLASVPAGAADRALGIGDAVRAALGRNTQALIAQESLEEQDAAIGLARSAFFPTVSANASAGNRKDPLNIGNPQFGGEPYNMYAFDLRASQPVFRGGAIVGGLSGARKNREVAQLDLQIAERDLQLRVISAFYATLLHGSRLQALEGQLASQKTLLTTLRERARVGRDTALDVLQIRTQVAILEPAISQARNEMETSSAELAELIGEREARELRLRGRLAAFDWKPVVERARASIERLPELRRAEVLEAAVDDRRRVALARHWPSVDLVGVWGRNAFVKTELLEAHATAWNFGVQLAIPLFSGLSSLQERRQLASQEKQARLAATRARDQAGLEQVRARKALETATEVQASRERAFTISRELIKEANRSFRLGTILYTQFLTAQRDAYQAELDHERAIHDYIQAVGRYMAATGLKLDALIAKLDSEGETK